MTALGSDRTYFQWREGLAWHAQIDDRDEVIAMCGRVSSRSLVSWSDRVPANGHLCGSCARIIASRTDIEPSRGRSWPVDDVPEPVTVEHDDSGRASA